MRDLVETVIDGILQREQMQRHAQQQRKHHAAAASTTHQSRPIDRTSLYATGKQTIASDKDKDPALWKVSRQFEAIFVQQMMSEMRKTVQKSDFMPHGFAEDVHGSMMDEAIAQASVRHHSFGIADNIYRQLEAGQKATMRPGAQQAASIQAISTSADTLTKRQDLILEAKSHAN